MKYYIVIYFEVIHQADLDFSVKLITGGFALRTLPSTIRTSWFSLAMSTSTVGVSRIPTAGGVIRSPYTGYTYGASFVEQHGDPHSSLVSTLVSYGKEDSLRMFIIIFMKMIACIP